jgi:Ca2+-binding EF-hand superfamily protein
MAARKLPKEVQQIFDRYITNNVRRLKREEAVLMLKTEFSFSDDEANSMFSAFDQDKNDIMSIWEFQQFYTCVGQSAKDMVEKFKALDKDGSGKLDIAEAKEGLKANGMGEKEIEFFLNTSTDADGLIDIGRFAGLLFKLKVYDSKKKPAAAATS